MSGWNSISDKSVGTLCDKVRALQSLKYLSLNISINPDSGHGLSDTAIQELCQMLISLKSLNSLVLDIEGWECVADAVFSRISDSISTLRYLQELAFD
jgi:hypothetical protein